MGDLVAWNASGVVGWIVAHWRLWAPVVLALGIVAGGSRFALRRPGFMAVGSLAAGLGWLLIVPGWGRDVLWPRADVEWLALPALVMAGLAAARLRGRWWTVGAVCLGAWWLASSPAGRVEFWRVGFGAVAVAGVLTLVGAAVPWRGVVVGLVVSGGVWAGNGPATWIVAALVLVAVCLGSLAGGGAIVVLPGLSMLGLVGAELGAGRALRGAVGVVDLSCLGALAAPLALAAVERRLRWMGRAAGAGAAVGVAGGVVGAAWVAARALR